MLYLVGQLPAFIHHYHYHEEEHGPIDILSFVDRHPGADSHHHDDDHELPYTHNHSSECNQVLPLACSEINFVHLPPEYPASETCIPPDCPFLASGFLGNIWQPPKMS